MMSGSRLRSVGAVADPDRRRSLLIAAHGDRGGAGEDRLTRDLVERLGASGQYDAVAAGFIRSKPSIREARDSLPDGPMSVYPLFMSAGYYVATAIPRDLGMSADGRDARGRPVTILRPLGLNPRLPELLARLASRDSSDAGLDPVAATLLLVAHGSSKDGKSRDAALAVSGAIEKIGGFARVETAFLEEAPYLEGTLRAVPGPAVMVGLFVGEGMHGGEDLPLALKQCGRDDVILAEPLSRSPELIALACDDGGEGAPGLSQMEP